MHPSPKTPGRRRGHALTVATAVLAAACGAAPTPEASEGVVMDVPASACTDSLLEAGGLPTVVTVPPACMRRALELRYRLRPDRRFLQAFAEVDHLLSHEPVAPVDAEWHDGWRLTYRGESIGTLPEFPDFRDAIDLLNDWTRRVAARHPLPLRPPGGADRAVSAQIEQFGPSSLRSGLRAIDARWSHGALTAPLLLAGARGLVYLAVQTVDHVELSDPLVARGLAAVALARTVGGQSAAREEALLADLMDQVADASRAVDSLPATDAVRAYVLRAEPQSRAIAERPGASALARYLYLVRLARETHLDAWSTWAASHAGERGLRTPIALASLRVNDFATHESVVPLLPYIVLADAWAASGQDTAAAAAATLLWGQSIHPPADFAEQLARRFGAKPGDVLRRFETAAAALDSSYAGPLLDGGVLASHYRADMYTVVQTLAWHSLDGLSSIPAAQGVVAGLDGVEAVPAVELRGWLADLTEVKEGRVNQGRLLHDLVRFKHIGESARYRVFQVLHSQSDYENPVLPDAVRLMAGLMDSRASDRADLAQLARNSLLDPVLAERLYASVMKATGNAYPDLRVWYAGYTADSAALQGIVADTTMDPDAGATAIERFAADSTIADSTARVMFTTLVSRAPDRWDVADRFARYLEAQHAYQEALQVAQAWLARNPHPADDFDAIAARTAAGRLLYRLRRYDDALAIVEPAVASGQGNAMAWAARILERLGRLGDALPLAEAAVDRYPDAPSARATQLEVLWHAGRTAEAARALLAAQPYLAQGDWRESIADAFADAFATLPADRAEAAFSALVAAGLPTPLLSQFVEGVDMTHRISDEVLFRTHEQLHPGRERASYALLLRSYRYLKRWKGDAAATQWIAHEMPGRVRAMIADLVYREGDDTLLWELADASGSGEAAEFTWLMRAAAFIRAGGSGPYAQRLREHYERAPAGEPYAVMGRHLLGLADERAVLALMATPRRRCEASYYLGLRAWRDRRYPEAIGWFRVAVETGESQNGEFIYAKDALLRLQNMTRSLDVIARQGGDPLRLSSR